MARRRAVAMMAVFVWVAAAGFAGCRSRALQPDSGTGTGVLPTGIGGGGDVGVGGAGAGAGVGGAGAGAGGHSIINVDAARDDDVAPRDGARDFPARPDTPPFLGSLTENYQCHTLPNTGPIVNPIGWGGEPPLPLAGGVIADGRYELVEVDFYPGDASIIWSTAMRRTITFQDSGARWLITDFILQSVIAGENDRFIAQVTYTSTNTFRAAFENCSTNEGVTNYQYEATPDTIAMWSETTRALSLYLRAP